MPKVNLNPRIAGTQDSLSTLETSTANVSNYIASLLNSSTDLGNWAMNIATGGNVQQTPGFDESQRPYYSNWLNNLGPDPTQYSPYTSLFGGGSQGGGFGSAYGYGPSYGVQGGAGTAGYTSATPASGSAAIAAYGNKGTYGGDPGSATWGNYQTPNLDPWNLTPQNWPSNYTATLGPGGTYSWQYTSPGMPGAGDTSGTSGTSGTGGTSGASTAGSGSQAASSSASGSTGSAWQPYTVISGGQSIPAQYNLDTGQIQVDQGGGWQSIGTANSDPTSAFNWTTGDPNSQIGNRSVPFSQAAHWAWAAPNQDQINEMIQNRKIQGTQQTQAGGGAGGGAGGTGGTGNQLGPLLTGELRGLATEQGIAGTAPPGLDPRSIAMLENQFFGTAARDVAFGQPGNPQIPGANLPASGIYPEQQALVDAQTQAAQAQIQQQLANEGLSSSTMGAELQGQLAQQGAADKGQLIQQNIQLAQTAQQVAQNWQTVGQNWAKLGIGEQTLGASEQKQIFDMFQGISEQYGGIQKQMWDEGIQGKGVLSAFISQLLGSYQLSTQQFGDVLQAEVGQAQAQATVEAAQLSAQAQQSSSMFGALGNILSSSSGVGGILSGVLGGVLSAI